MPASIALAGGPSDAKAFTYQGYLSSDGVPLNGAYDCWFTLWDSELAGQQVAQYPSNGDPISVSIVDGLFTTKIDFDVSVYTNDPIWLQIEFDSGGDDGLVTLSRQLITAAPYALQTRGLFVDGMGSFLVLPSGGEIDNAAGLRVDGNKLYTTASNNGTQQDVMRMSSEATDFLDENGIALLHISNSNGRIGVGNDNPQDMLHVSGIIRSSGVRLVGGADIAEPFDIHYDGEIVPGMVVAIQPDRVGSLQVASSPYDSKVAGVISGAGGINAAMTLTQEDTIVDGEYPVALTGRVWCLVDADANGAVAAGDLLTTSSTPGHAMRASDRSLAFGSTIGKAMTPLESGKGLVLVLVNLH